MKVRMAKFFSIIMIFFLFAAHLSFAQAAFPGKTWEKIKNPADLGYSLAKLEAAREFAEKGKTAAVVIVVNGKILYEWGRRKGILSPTPPEKVFSALCTENMSGTAQSTWT
jgi:hypothetical protein